MEESDREGQTPAASRRVPPCGNPTCPAPMSTVRLQNIPEDFAGIVREGATAFHRMKAPCARYFGFRDEPQKPGRKRKVDEKLAILYYI